MKSYNIDNITEPKVPFRGFRGGLSVLLLALGMLASPLYGQEIFKGGERQPFDSQPLGQSEQALKAPGTGGPGLPPPTENDKVGGAPVRDVFWLWPFMAVGYVVYRRKTLKSPQGTWAQQNKQT